MRPIVKHRWNTVALRLHIRRVEVYLSGKTMEWLLVGKMMSCSNEASRQQAQLLFPVSWVASWRPLEHSGIKAVSLFPSCDFESTCNYSESLRKKSQTRWNSSEVSVHVNITNLFFQTARGYIFNDQKWRLTINTFILWKQLRQQLSFAS